MFHDHQIIVKNNNNSSSSKKKVSSLCSQKVQNKQKIINQKYTYIVYDAQPNQRKHFGGRRFPSLQEKIFYIKYIYKYIYMYWYLNNWKKVSLNNYLIRKRLFKNN